MRSFHEDELAFTSLHGKIMQVRVVLVWDDFPRDFYSCLCPDSKAHDFEEGTLFRTIEEALAYQVMTS